MAGGRWTRWCAVLAVALPLAGCASPSPTPSPSSSSPSTAQTRSASPATQEFTPVIKDLRFVGEIEEDGDGELEQALSDGEIIATVRNDLSDVSFTVTGYSAATGKEIWRRSGQGWLECAQSSPIVCQTTSYERGSRTVEEVSVLSLDRGKLTKLDVGKGGKFEFAGTYDGAAYFLTWQGTDDIHMTSFDGSGAPVSDKNLQAPAPQKASDSTVSADMAGPYVSVRTEGTSGVYVAGRNGYREIAVAGPCMALDDGAVCQSEEGLVAVGPDSSQKWSLKTDVKVAPSVLPVDLSLSEAKKLFEGDLSEFLQARDASSRTGQGDEAGQPGAGSQGDDTDAEAGAEAASLRSETGSQSSDAGAEAGNLSDVSGGLAAAAVDPTPGRSGEPAGAGVVKAASTDEPESAETSSPAASETSPASATPSASPSQPASPSQSASPSPSSTTGEDPGTGDASSPASASPERAPTRSPQPIEGRLLVATADGPGIATVADGRLTLSDGRVVDLQGGSLVGLDLSHEIAVVDVERRWPQGGENSGVAVVSSILVDGDGAVLADLDLTAADQIAASGEGGDLFKPFGFAWQEDSLVFVDAVGRKIGIYTLEEK